MSRIKGTNLAHTRTHIETTYGAEGWATVAAEMTTEARRALDAVVAVGWYAGDLHVEMLRALEETHGKADRSVLARAAERDAEFDVSRIHRVMFRALNPGLLLERGMDVWGRFFDSGQWVIERTSATSARGTLVGFGIVDARYCRYLTAYLRRLLELVGARNARILHPRCRGRGDDACILDSEWQ
jgi:hypothetical protein